MVPLLRSSDTETVTAAVAALRNLSIHKGNEVYRKTIYIKYNIVEHGLVYCLVVEVRNRTSTEAQEIFEWGPKFHNYVSQTQIY